MFLKLLKLVIFSCLLSLAALSSAAAESNFKRIVVFGDSLSDNGNLFKLSEGELPKAPYFNGRFTNGKVWVELLASALRLDTNIKTQFADYAYGGAWAADEKGSYFNLPSELDEYLQDYPAHSIDESNTLFIMWIGNNDYLQDGRLNEDPATVVNETISSIEAHIEKLIDSKQGAGAKHFLILNLPNLGETPKAKSAITPEQQRYANNISLLSNMHNSALAQLINRLTYRHPDVTFTFFDLAAHFDDLIKHPEKYQIKNVSEPCFVSGWGGYDEDEKKSSSIKTSTLPLRSALQLNINFSPNGQIPSPSNTCSNPDKYVFWDYVHPTARAHELIAHFVTEALTAPKHG